MRQDSGSAAAERVSIGAVDPHALRAVGGLDRYAVSGTLGEELLSLVRLRASQLNGCAYCLDLHAGEARAVGVTQRQLDVLAAYHEAASLFSARQLAALRLTDAVTQLGRDGVPDEVWDPVAEQFDDAEMVQLLIAICAINAWNRIAISTRQALPAGGR